MLDEAAFITLELQDGTKFRWRIPKKYAWKLFLERWNNKYKETPKEEPEKEKSEDDESEKFKLW